MLLLIDWKAIQNYNQEVKLKEKGLGTKYLLVWNAIFGCWKDIQKYLENRSSEINCVVNHENIL